MTIVGSGAISLSAIRNELSAINGSYSLRSLSSTAGKGTPDAMSEFYGYQFYWTSTVAMVGGGGGGGYYNGGGGGGGGRIGETNVTMYRNTNYSFTVGAGGAGDSDYGGNGGQGGNSNALGYTGQGGGGGGSRVSGLNSDCSPTNAGQPGGCGGGGSGSPCSEQGGGSGNQGYGGSTALYFYGGSGGGMGQAGQTNGWGLPTKGGNGANALGRTYGAGGGGGTWSGDPGANGGDTGGGRGGDGRDPCCRQYSTQGADSEGAGGGGGGQAIAWGFPGISPTTTSAFAYGSKGGNGQIRLRYPNPQRLDSGGGSTQWNGGDGYFYHEINQTTNFTTYAG